MVVVVRVAEGANDAETISNVIGGTDAANGSYEGVQAFLGAKSEVHVEPRILCAPGFISNVTRDGDGDINGAPVLSEMETIANRLRAVVIADGPNTNDAEAITFRKLFGSARIYIVDPWVRVWDTVNNAEKTEPASARVAGLISKCDNERGFWWSPSNQTISGILGTAREVDFTLDDKNCRANYLNENEVTTIIHEDGYRLWGNRGAIDQSSPGGRYAFLNVRRTADIIQDSILRAHLWAIDRNINRTYLEDVTEGVNAYLRHLATIGAIIGGECWADPELNTPDQIAQGKVYFDFKFTPQYPAEHVIFRSHLTNDLLTEIFTDEQAA